MSGGLGQRFRELQISGKRLTDKKSTILERREEIGPLVQIELLGKGPLFSERRVWMKPVFMLVRIFVSSLDPFCHHQRGFTSLVSAYLTTAGVTKTHEPLVLPITEG